jgi:glutathione S-transferase
MTTEPAQFITIPLSHYCEKARWALDRVALPYQEQAHAPLLHRLATRRQRGKSVPILVHGDRKLLDSTAILEYADHCGGGDRLYPADPALRSEVCTLEEHFDAQLGPQTRRWAYGFLLSQPALLRSLWSQGVPRSEAFAMPLLVPVVSRLVASGYKVTNEGAQRSVDRIGEVFSDVERRLADGRPYLVAGRFSAADLTFAALAAPVLLPLESRAAQPGLEALPTAMQEQILGFRRTVAGEFALRMFAQERGVGACVPGRS